MKQPSLPILTYELGDPIPVTRYSGQKSFPRLSGFLDNKAQHHVRKVILTFPNHAGQRVAYLYPSKKGQPAGRFKETSMRDWHIDVGTLERLRATLNEHNR